MKDTKAYIDENGNLSDVIIYAAGVGEAETTGERLVLTDDYNEHGQTCGCSWKAA